MHVADAGAGAPADAEADRREDHVVPALIIDAGAADEIEAAVDAGEALEDVLGLGQVVDQDEDLRGVGAEVEADRGALPIDLLAAAALQRQHAVAIAQADADGAGELLALDVAVGPALVLEGLFDDLGQPLGRFAKEVGGGLEDRLLVDFGFAAGRVIAVLQARRRTARQGRGTAPATSPAV